MASFRIVQQDGAWVIQRHSSHHEEFFWTMTLCRCLSVSSVEVLQFESEAAAIKYFETEQDLFGPWQFIRCVNLTEGEVCYISDVALREGYLNYYRRVHLEYAKQAICEAYMEANRERRRWTAIGIYPYTTHRELWRCYCGKPGIEVVWGKLSSRSNKLHCFCNSCLRGYRRLEKEEAKVSNVRKLIRNLEKELKNVEDQKCRPVA